VYDMSHLCNTLPLWLRHACGGRWAWGPTRRTPPASQREGLVQTTGKRAARPWRARIVGAPGRRHRLGDGRRWGMDGKGGGRLWVNDK